VIANALVAVAEVLGLDDVEDLAVTLDVRHGHQLGPVLHDPTGQGRDVVKSLALTVDGVFHGLEEGLLQVELGQVLVVLVLLHSVLALDVHLELGGNALEDVDLPDRQVLADGQASDSALPQLDLEGLVADGQALELTLALRNLRPPAQGQLGLDLSVLGLRNLCNICMRKCVWGATVICLTLMLRTSPDLGTTVTRALRRIPVYWLSTW
jgi:hypothetical protein